MKGFTLFVSVFAMFIAGSANAAFDLVSAKVAKVTDGDTIRIQPDETKKDTISIRMIGIDTPELHLPTPHNGMVGQLPWGQDAGNALAAITPVNSDVVVQNHGTDSHGRMLGRVYAGRRDVNLQMLQNGWATPYIICDGKACNSSFFKDEKVAVYLKACEDARTQGLGVFNPTNVLNELPFQFRIRMQERQYDKYVGDFVTKKFYRPADYAKVDVCRRIFFLTQKDAKNVGYKPDFNAE